MCCFSAVSGAWLVLCEVVASVTLASPYINFCTSSKVLLLLDAAHETEMAISGVLTHNAFEHKYPLAESLQECNVSQVDFCPHLRLHPFSSLCLDHPRFTICEDEQCCPPRISHAYRNM